MTDPNAGFPTGNNSYGAPQPAQPASDANAAYQQPQYTAPVPPAQPVPPAGAPYQAPATPDYAANIQNSVAGFAQNLGGKNVTVGGQSFDFISIITYVAGVLAIIACIVPFVSISAFGYSGSVSLFQGGDGWIVLVAVLAIAALTFFKKHLPAMIISALVLVLSIFEMVYSKSKINGINGSLDEFGSNYGSLGSLASGYAKNAVAFGIGAYLLIIAALGLIVGTVLAFGNQRRPRRSRCRVFPPSRSMCRRHSPVLRSRHLPPLCPMPAFLRLPLHRRPRPHRSPRLRMSSRRLPLRFTSSPIRTLPTRGRPRRPDF